ncbi:MAG TPA: HlyD family secretion protein [Nevskiaceae bacterium]|nr:HlyD family secretion protein [Nevskiaceae bacterium]
MSFEAVAAPAAVSGRKSLRVPLMVGGVGVVAIVATIAWFTGGRYMSTDDAYVQAARASISSNVAGRVVEIAVHDNQPVHRGDLLFRVDDQPFRIAVESAQAKLAAAKLQVGAGKAAYAQQMAAVGKAQENVAFRQRELDRQQKVLAQGLTSKALYDQALHDRDAARAELVAAQQQAQSILAMLGGDVDVDPDQHPTVLEAKAELDKAQLNLSYTRITAPDDGVVAKVEQLQVGDYINAASPAFALLSTHDVWIEANFKEDQLTHMHPGQAATVRIDSYPGREFKAHVESVAPGTGSQFSALPAENATGNWVKVVQRLPVRLALDDADAATALRSGLSATAKVDTEHSRKLFGS